MAVTFKIPQKVLSPNKQALVDFVREHAKNVVIGHPPNFNAWDVVLKSTDDEIARVLGESFTNTGALKKMAVELQGYGLSVVQAPPMELMLTVENLVVGATYHHAVQGPMVLTQYGYDAYKEAAEVYFVEGCVKMDSLDTGMMLTVSLADLSATIVAPPVQHAGVLKADILYYLPLCKPVFYRGSHITTQDTLAWDCVCVDTGEDFIVLESHFSELVPPAAFEALGVYRAKKA